MFLARPRKLTFVSPNWRLMTRNCCSTLELMLALRCSGFWTAVLRRPSGSLAMSLGRAAMCHFKSSCCTRACAPRSDERLIRYRLVDEYDGDTLTSATEMSSAQLLTLGELTDFVFGVWPLIDVLESNFEHDLEQGLDFFDASSDFYPGFDAECRGRVIEYSERFAHDDGGVGAVVCQ